MNNVITPTAAGIAAFGDGTYQVYNIYRDLKPGVYTIQQFNGSDWIDWGSTKVQGNDKNRNLIFDDNLVKRLVAA